jgi:hypothetical protein
MRLLAAFFCLGSSIWVSSYLFNFNVISSAPAAVSRSVEAPETLPPQREVAATQLGWLTPAPVTSPPSSSQSDREALEALEVEIGSATMFCVEQPGDCPAGFRCELGACAPDLAE